MKNNLLLIGAGKMAEKYIKILYALKQPFEVIGRGKYSAKKFHQRTRCIVNTGGLKSNVNKIFPNSSAIVAVSVDQLFDTTKDLLNLGVKRILLEKPGAVNLKQIRLINSLAKKKRAKIYIGYNRRFYQSIEKIKKLSSKDGGILSVNFEFTERSHLIKKLKIIKRVKEKWLIANSSHVIDLVFYLCGKPRNIHSLSQGKIDWHKRSSIFCGSGMTKKGILFSYFSNWNSPGNWKVELMTAKSRYILNPMEELKIIRFPSLKEKKIKLINNLDNKFKAGLFIQTKNFLNKNDTNLCSLKEQEENFRIFYKIANYN